MKINTILCNQHTNCTLSLAKSRVGGGGGVLIVSRGVAFERGGGGGGSDPLAHYVQLIG